MAAFPQPADNYTPKVFAVRTQVDQSLSSICQRSISRDYLKATLVSARYLPARKTTIARISQPSKVNNERRGVGKDGAAVDRVSSPGKSRDRAPIR